MSLVSNPFKPELWQEITKFNFTDLTFHTSLDQKVFRIGFNRPESRNSFRPQTVDELLIALQYSQESKEGGVILITGNGPSPKDGGWAFCSGGDQRVRGRAGYQYSLDSTCEAYQTSGKLNILEVQRLIRFMPKVVIAVVSGWAVGGGHSLHVVCDLTIASEQKALFKQTDADVASFDSGFGSAYLARQIGQKRAREIFFCGFTYSALEAKELGMVNFVAKHDELEDVALKWAEEINSKSPTSIRMLKFGFNLIDDGLIGQQIFAGEATRLAYGTEEATEGRDAFLNKRPRDFSKFPWSF
jgi:naphthoate synthase